jgi:hypothetical protein
MGMCWAAESVVKEFPILAGANVWGNARRHKMRFSASKAVNEAHEAGFDTIRLFHSAASFLGRRPDMRLCE